MDRTLDRRSTPYSGRIAHISLQGQIDAQLTAGEPASVAPALADLLASPGGKIDRQVIHGEALTLIDRKDGYAYVMALKDGYCGWLQDSVIGPAFTPNHKVRSPATHLYPEPSATSPATLSLYMGARVEVTGRDGKWAITPQGYIPASHLIPLDDYAEDPVAVAEMFLHTPYFWGGNSAAGIDCSGLAQAAMLAVGIPCPGDSDQQQSIGTEIPEDAPLQRGDLIFWRGHVALMTSPDQIIHANGGSMSVAYEDLQTALNRIAAQGEGGLVARRRPR